ncbi:protein disulfide-isomerase-like [Macrosteles quadrilineatus]|uniref:protein disulfide-isomerase-like n=1 Tax=Macrosteles quadrilineatus TaxID=74068 RepID=UPI0023E1001A|nr:protein disulfide-isomerase-like [Macrosteles quadrilineatus]
MVLRVVTLVVLCLIGNIYAEITEDEGVLVLTKANFQQALSENEFLLVEFYAPWCGHCKALAPEYVKAAESLKKAGSPIRLAKVDATQEPELSEEHGVRGYPTLKFFKNSNPVPYSGGRSANDIVSWLTKKTGPPAKVIESLEDAKAFVDSADVTIVGFFKDDSSDLAKAFNGVADALDDYVFAITSNADFAKEHGIEDEQIVLFKKFDDGKSVYEGKAEVDAVKKFVQTESLPLVVEFNHDTAQKIFGGDIKSHLLLFLSKAAGHYEDLLVNAKNVAAPFRDQILFVSINADEEDHGRILEFFGMKKDEVPSMRIIKLEEDMAKYKPANAELESDNIKSFVQDFLEGKLKQHLLSQDLPDDWDAKPVKTLVATNFDEIVFNKDKLVLVEFYAPWCGHCKQLSPIYDDLGKEFESRDDVVIAKIDSTANELEHTKITSFPTLKLYTKGDNKAIEYSGERTLKGLTAFINSGGVEGAPGQAEAEEEDEDDDLPKKDEL